jgi:heat shock protein HslJ
MKKRDRLILFNLLLGSLLLVACVGLGNPLDGTNWQLDKYRDESGNLVSVKTDTVVTAQFQATKVSGIAGCNNYNSSYQVNGNQLTFSPAATTRKLCIDPLGIMKQEGAILAALSEVQTFRQRGNTLEMQGLDGETLLEYSPLGQ